MIALKQRIIYLTVLIILLVLACLPLEGQAGAQINQMLKVTLTVYALARALNAAISVAQGTEVSIEPMGVGLTLTPGQILDPLNDLIEQFSLVLLMASASLGVQKILLTMGDIAAFRYFLAGLTLLAMVCLLLKTRQIKWQKRLVAWVVIISVIRLAVPATALVAHHTQEWLQADRTAALAELEATREQVTEVTAEASIEDQRWYQGFRDALDIRSRLAAIEVRAERGVEAAIYLLAEFFLIMLLIPLAFIYIALKIITRMLNLPRQL